MTPEELQLLFLRIEWWLEKTAVIGRLRIIIGFLDLRIYAFLIRIAVRDFIKARFALLYHVLKNIFRFTHRPPPVVGPSDSVNKQDRQRTNQAYDPIGLGTQSV
jgi:hypothetical protein